MQYYIVLYSTEEYYIVLYSTEEYYAVLWYILYAEEYIVEC